MNDLNETGSLQGETALAPEPASGAAGQPVPARRSRSKKTAKASPDGGAVAETGADPSPPPQKRKRPRAKARQAEETPDNPEAAENREAAVEESGEEDSAEKLKRKSRRGRRGGKNRARKSADDAPRELLSPVEIAAMLMLVPALPPGRGAKRKTRKEAAPKPEAPRSVKKMFISVLQGEQVEVALTENGVLAEYYLDMLHQSKLKGNIYKGVVHNIDSNLQAAFVDYGGGKNGFLQIDQIHPEYWRSLPDAGRDKKFPSIQKALKLGQELLVQVVKEPAGSKGAFLTTWLSIAGRFLVLTPGQEQIGVSRKVAEPEERARLRELIGGIDPGKGFGVIVRTVGEGATKTTLKNDLQYLKRVWREIRKRATEMSAPALIHQEPGLPERSVRDYLTDDVAEIWVDNEDEAEHVRQMVSLLSPRKKDLVRFYSDSSQPMWEKFQLSGQLEQIYSREIGLPSGGRLVFDQTEALMAIDINSGKISGKNNFEAMAYKTNMEASEAIARQLRLRDIGGQVVIDFIEMRDKKHVLDVEKNLRQAMKSDRARHDVLRMSSFGLLELVRQRMGSSALSISMEICDVCGGTGLRRNLEWQALHALRDMRRKARSCAGPRYVCELSRELGMYLLNHKREALRRMEDDLGKTLEIQIRI